jgi:hypothetical protein
MTIRKQIGALLITVAALTTLSSVSLAQMGSSGSGGSTRCTATYAEEGSPSSDLIARARITLFSLFSWGRGPVNHSGSMRSSFAVLRERRGLTR